MFNYTQLQNRCLSPTNKFWGIGATAETKSGRYEFIDNKAKVLAVAHLDSVQTNKHFYKITINGITYVLNPQLDDRLGVYVILDLLPSMGIKYDILLTEGEEVGKSTAEYFTTKKRYNWMFSFDRQGEDVVYYRYHSIEFVNMLTGAGFLKTERGARSDIDYLEHLECKGFNVGTGLEDGHSMWAKNNMNQLARQVDRFIKFYKAHYKTHLKHEKYVYTPAVYKSPKEHGHYYHQNWVQVKCKGDCDSSISETFAKNNNGYCWPCSEKIKDEEIDDGVMCLKCKGEVDNDSPYADLCSKCLVIYDVCAVSQCRKIVLINTMEQGMCLVCANKAKKNMSERTDITCSGDNCSTKLYSTELLRGDVCALCWSRETRSKYDA